MKPGMFFTALVLCLTSGALIADPARLLDRLRINHAAMVSSEQDFHNRQRRGTLSGVEASDYAAYVARLHRLVAEDCAELMQAGVSLPPELGCPEVAPAMAVPAAIDQASEQSLAEQLAVLDAELLGGLGDFDELLLREQERVRAQAPMGDAAGGGEGSGSGSGNGSGGSGEAGEGEGADGEGGGRDGAGEASGERGSAEGASGQTQTTTGRGDAGGGMSGRRSGQGSSGSGRRGGVPRDIPDGDDDDVVARQLREAAEKETSPELKEKLWEEYRRYKQGTR